MPKLLMHTGRALTPRRLISSVSILAIALIVAGTDMSMVESSPLSSEAPFAAALANIPAPGLQVLAESDRHFYRIAFQRQHEKQFSEADNALSQVSDPLLKGEVLAERYLSGEYKATCAELAQWLSVYNDHPRAEELYHIALSRRAAGIDLPVPPQAVSALKGYSNGYGKSTLHDAAKKEWLAGLAAYRAQNMPVAAAHFSHVLNDAQDLSPKDKAAASFWAYRALFAAGDIAAAMHYAELAASEPPSFYSILARHVTGERSVPVEDKAAKLESVAPLLANNAVRRAVALKEVEQDALAEQELRVIFPASDDADRKRLVTLASLLDLPAAQIRMALEYAQNGEEASDALYPMPRWAPTSGYSIEPALLFAIMRQESGFNPKAKSPAGALGVMQLMPATAHAMARTSRVSGLSIEPSVSMTLGQTYIERLMETPFIGDNLVFLTASYNAGPGTVAEWKHSLSYNNDPLLFIESIPYGETREYVTQVIGNYWVYSELLGDTNPSAVSALSEGQWPLYDGSDKHLASMQNRLATN